MQDDSLPRVPWSCRWSRLGGAVRDSTSVESPDVFWTCHPPELSAQALFLQEQCRQCQQWQPAPGPARTVGHRLTFHDVARDNEQPRGAIAKVHRYARGEAIFDEGATAHHFYTIAGGSVKLVKMTPSGKEVIIGFLCAGSPICADAASVEGAFPASAVALEDTTCVLVSQRALRALVEQHPYLASGILVGLSKRLAEFADRIAEVGVGRVEPRLARLFLKLTATVGRRERDGFFVPVPLSRQELADVVCATIETCIRIMSRWGKQNIVATSKDGFLVIDREILQVLAQADLNGSCEPVARPAR